MAKKSTPSTTKLNKVTVSKADLAFLNAMIEFEQEAQSGQSEKVTIFLDANSTAAFTGAFLKAGKWAWKNKYKLLAAGEAVWDLLGGITSARQDVAENKEGLSLLKPAAEEGSRLKELLKIRDQIQQQQNKTK
jgi:hypothetical protein